jgi:hypothetical protein
MAKETTLVGCRLPNGFVLHHPKDRNQFVKLAGTNEAGSNGLYLAPKQFTLTAVDSELWAEWRTAYVGFEPLKTRAIFEARSEQEAGIKARESENVKTGFEGTAKEMVIGGQEISPLR